MEKFLEGFQQMKSKVEQTGKNFSVTARVKNEEVHQFLDAVNVWNNDNRYNYFIQCRECFYALSGYKAFKMLITA